MEEPKIAGKSPMIMTVEKGTYHWCACGKSGIQPFCDGSHEGSDFKPVRVDIGELKKIAWCMCKKTKNPPFCDGTHLSLK